MNIIPIKIFQYPSNTSKQKNVKTHTPTTKTWLKKSSDQGIRRFQENEVTSNRLDAIEKQLVNGALSRDLQKVNKFEKTPETKGFEQHKQEQIVKSENDRQRVDEMVRKSNRLIYSISTFLSSIFPWNLFASTIEVEESRVTFLFKQPLSSQSHSLDIKDISNVFIEQDMFFATLQVVSRTFIQNDIRIKYLRKYDAKKMRVIIEGMRTFANKNIDTSNYEKKELINKLEELHVIRN